MVHYSCSACDHQLHNLAHLLLGYPASDPLRRVIFGTTSSNFDLWSRPRGLAVEFPRNSSAPPSLRRVAPPPLLKHYRAVWLMSTSRVREVRISNPEPSKSGLSDLYNVANGWLPLQHLYASRYISVTLCRKESPLTSGCIIQWSRKKSWV